MSVLSKRRVDRVIGALPVYRLAPSGPAYAYAGVRFIAKNGTSAELVDFSRRIGALSVARPTSAVLVARAALHTGDDDLLKCVLRVAQDRFPDFGALLEIEAQWRDRRGDYEGALELVRRARLVQPASTVAAGLEVRLSYLAEESEADRVALDALRRFPLRSGVIWPVARGCRTGEQFHRLVEAINEETADTDRRASIVPPMSLAALRAGCPQEGVDYVRSVIEAVLEAEVPPPIVTVPTVSAVDAWDALLDLTDLFEQADIPFFFAAGTLLGLLREGRPLDQDHDVDVGVVADDHDQWTLRRVFQDDPRFALGIPDPTPDRQRFLHRTGVPIDLFAFYQQEGRLWHDGGCARWCHAEFSIDHLSIDGYRLPIPSDPEQFLRESFGDRWREVGPDFDAYLDEAPNREFTSPHCRRLHGLVRALGRLSGGDRVAAASDLGAIGEEQLAARIGALHV